MSETLEIKRLIEEQGRAWDEFRGANDERIKQLETRGSVDAALVEKVEKANAAITEAGTEIKALQKRIDEAELSANRAALGTDKRSASPAARVHREAFQNFLRKGEEAGLRELEVNASVNTGTDADGGFAVPEELDRTLIELLKPVSPMREICRVITVGTTGYRKLVNKHGAASGWVGETAARPVTNTPTLGEVKPYWGEIYANPQTTQQALDDIFFDVEAWLNDEVALEFGYQEGVVFISGNGTDKPRGFLHYPNSAARDSARPFGTLQLIESGAATGLGTNPDVFIDVVHSLKAGHRARARWLMNTLTTAAVRKFKDDDGQYLWRPGLEMGQPDALLGYPVTDMEDMPDIAADSIPVAFGDFLAGYTIADRVGTRVLRDPYTNKPYVGFYTTKRVGGMVENSEAIKLLKVAAPEE